MSIRSAAFALVVASLAVLLGSGFFLPRVAAYVPMAMLALAMLLGSGALTRRTFNFLRAGGLALLCGGPVLLSGLVNGGDPSRLLAPGAFLAFALAAYWVGRGFQPGDLGRVSVISSTIAVILMAAAIVLRHWDLVGAIRSGNRFFADANQIVTGMNPTVIGLMAMAVLLAALASESLPFTIAMLAATGLLVVAVSSRSALMTMIVAWGASRFLLRRRRIGTLALGAIGAVLGALLGMSLFAGKARAVANALFLVNDQYRGLGSGGSGRSMIWSFFYENWLSHPIFGSGPGTAFGSGSSSLYSHNMLLQILTDGGLISLASFMVVLVVATLSAQRLPQLERRIFLTTLLAYLVYGIFEGRAINIGNPISAYFYFVVFATLGMTETATEGLQARTFATNNGDPLPDGPVPVANQSSSR